MKKILAVLLCLVMCTLLLGCNETADDDKMLIVVTAFPQYDFARQITKDVDNVEIKMLVSPGAEVHAFEPTPRDMLDISACDVFIYTGGESDIWVKNVLSSIDNENMTLVSFADICGIENEGHEDHDHEHVYDEHVWTSPKKARVICQSIAKTLADKDEANKDKYNKNLEAYLSELQVLDDEFENIVDNKKRDYIVVGDRFPFFHMAHDYGFEYKAAFSGCSSSTEPSAKTIGELSMLVKDEKIPYVFVIEFSNGKIADSIIDKSSCQKLTLHSCHNVAKSDFDDGVTYVDLMKQNADNLRKALCE